MWVRLHDSPQCRPHWNQPHERHIFSCCQHHYYTKGEVEVVLFEMSIRKFVVIIADTFVRVYMHRPSKGSVEKYFPRKNCSRRLLAKSQTYFFLKFSRHMDIQKFCQSATPIFAKNVHGKEISFPGWIWPNLHWCHSWSAV